MQIGEHIRSYYSSPSRLLKISYSDLVACNLDIGFTSEFIDGKDYHKITRDISLSVMHFDNDHIINLLFCNGNPIRIELTDREIVSYCLDYIELRYIISGHLEVEIENTIECFEENEICFIDSKAYHRELVDSSDCLLLNINIRKELFDGAFLNNIMLSPLERFLRSNIMEQRRHRRYLKFIPDEYANTEAIKSLLSQIFFEAKSCQAGYLDISRGYIIRLVSQLSSGYKYNFDQDQSRLYSLSLFESISEYMQNNLNSVSMEQLTQQFHYQPNYFNTLIKEHAGMTYSHYLIHLRIERAKYLLMKTELPIEEIMWMIGYNNKGFFYSKFTESTNMTPSKYRKCSRKLQPIPK